MSVNNQVGTLEKKLSDIIQFLSENYALIHAHMVDFITDNQWNCLNINMQNNLLELEDDFNVILKDDFINPRRQKQFPHLCNFIQRANALTLKQIGVSKSLIDVLPAESVSHQSSSISDVHKWCTKLKKQHEVQKMAFAISTLAKIHDVNLVVDIGSGKGYLASYISHFHYLPALGIEACSKRNQSAIIRDTKLSNMCIKQVRKNDSTDSINPSSNDDGTASSHFSQNANNFQNSRYNFITNYINATSDLKNIITQNISTINFGNNSKTLPIENKYSVTDGETRDESKNKQQPLNILLCGLHTCGNLAVTILRQFVSCNIVNVLCSIGCCYNLLKEEFSPEPSIEMDSQMEFGFPLSSILRNMEFSLGRKARMLALQSKDRMSRKKLQQSLFYRALLQVILCEQYAVDRTTEIQVGRLAGKCHSFKDYVGKALQRLNLNQSIITSETLEFYLHTYGAEEKKLKAFQMLRMVLAPLIETVILLDRLLYLHEQHCVKEAHLIQLFDPVISPRCYALIAVK